MKLVAIEHNNAARRLMARGSWREAEERFVKAVAMAPNWSEPWYYLGVLYKQQRKWHKALECNQRATQLNPGDRAAWWNLGLAATAVGNWREARRAWLLYGLEVPLGDDSPDLNLGISAVRVDLTGTAEVVWCNRLDPARAVIQNVPLPTSRHRFGDLLLNDGVAMGYRLYQGRRITIFDEIAVLMPSTYATYEVIVENVTNADRVALMALAEKHEIGIEEWSTSHVNSQKRPAQLSRPVSEVASIASNSQAVKYGVAAHSREDVTALLETWRSSPGTSRGCSIQNLHCVFASFAGVA